MGVVDTGFILVAGYIEGAVIFSNFNSTDESNISLEVNPYSEPLFSNSVAVYGIADSASTIGVNDLSKATYLGSFANLSSLKFNQEAYFNVTSFVQSAQGTDFEFILVDNDGVDNFSSVEQNYGTPSGLEVITAPEPSTWELLFGGLGLLVFSRRFRMTPRLK
jgi:hypothetical protein